MRRTARNDGADRCLTRQGPLCRGRQAPASTEADPTLAAPPAAHRCPPTPAPVRPARRIEATPGRRRRRPRVMPAAVNRPRRSWISGAVGRIDPAGSRGKFFTRANGAGGPRRQHDVDGVQLALRRARHSAVAAPRTSVPKLERCRPAADSAEGRAGAGGAGRAQPAANRDEALRPRWSRLIRAAPGPPGGRRERRSCPAQSPSQAPRPRRQNVIALEVPATPR